MTKSWRSRFKDAEMMVRFGAKLASALFPPAVNDTLHTLLGDHERIRLVIDAPPGDLSAVPWEAATATFLPSGDGDLGRLTVSDLEEISLVRRPPGEILGPPDPISGPVRVRYALGPDFLPDRRFEPLGDPSAVLKKLQALAGIEFDSTDRGVLFSTAIKGLRDFQIFHFFGHGIADGNDASLVFGRENQLDYIRADDVKHHFTTAPDLRMAVLCACYSGATSAESLNRAWSELRIGVVVGMQRRVSEWGASAFTVAFYTELSSSGDLDLAMWRGRQALRDTEGSLMEQVTPVVYTRYQTGLVAIRRPDDTADEAHPTEPPRKDKLGSKPVVRRYPHAGYEVPLAGFLDGPLEMEMGYFSRHPRSITAFLGPGTLQIGSSVEQIRWDPALDAAAASDKELSGFLQTLRERRGAKRPVVPLPDTGDQVPVSQVRVALAKLAHAATQAFLHSSLKQSIPINQLEQHEVRTSPKSAFRLALGDAIAACERAQSIDGEPTLLGEQRLASRLAELQRRLNEDGGILRGSTVEWLTSLLWHSLVCDSALYPHVEELALQVSLLHGSEHQPTRRLDPAAAVMRASLRELGEATARAVARGFNPDEEPDSPRRRFFATLARLLHAEFDSWQSPRSPYAAERIPAPIALTANFDLELERGLAAGGRPFNVAVPVYVGVVNDDIHAGDDLRWLVGRFQCADANPTRGQLATPFGPWRWLASCATGDHEGCDLDGPLLVKLNGSPLHQIPLKPHDPLAPGDLVYADGVRRSKAPVARGNFGEQAAERRAANAEDVRRVEIEHALALGEYDFLQVTRVSQWSFVREQQNEPNDGLPFWLCAQLIRSDRYWMLLGHRFANWNTRTQMFTFLMNDSNRARPVDNKRGCAIALEFDQDRIRFLDWLGITRATGDLDELTKVLQRMAEKRRSTDG
ncbi:MAG: CHAT domain-containing protein [Acidimicrobiales bacterium]